MATLEELRSRHLTWVDALNREQSAWCIVLNVARDAPDPIARLRGYEAHLLSLNDVNGIRLIAITRQVIAELLEG